MVTPSPGRHCRGGSGSLHSFPLLESGTYPEASTQAPGVVSLTQEVPLFQMALGDKSPHGSEEGREDTRATCF